MHTLFFRSARYKCACKFFFRTCAHVRYNSVHMLFFRMCVHVHSYTRCLTCVEVWKLPNHYKKERALVFTILALTLSRCNGFGYHLCECASVCV